MDRYSVIRETEKRPGLNRSYQFEGDWVEFDRNGEASFTWSIQDLGDLEWNAVRILVELEHGEANALQGVLRGPSGQEATLFRAPGGRARFAREMRTWFSDRATFLLKDGASPWPGCWKSEEPLLPLAIAGVAGDWTLEIGRVAGAFRRAGRARGTLVLVGVKPVPNYQKITDFGTWFPLGGARAAAIAGQGQTLTTWEWEPRLGVRYQRQKLVAGGWSPCLGDQVLFRERFPGGVVRNLSQLVKMGEKREFSE